MRKILLAIEDYNELIFLETLYKKLGLNVEGVQNDTAIPEKLLGFDPDMIIITTYGTRVNATRLLGRIKKKAGYPKIIVLYQKGRGGAEKDVKGFTIDALLESPLHPPILLEATERLLEITPGALTKKLERIDMGGDWATANDDNQVQHIKGKGGKPLFPLNTGEYINTSLPIELRNYKASTELTPEKNKKKLERYKAMAESEFLPPHQKIGRDRVAKIEKEFRDREGDEDIADIDKERLAFAKALFKK